jgi:hypothetical protein
MRFRFLFLFGVVAIIAACGTPPTPVSPTTVPLPPAPTADAAATEAAVALKIFATLTASAPQDTVTPPPLPNATATNPPAPTVPAPTLVVELSPSVTPIPALPTRPPAVASPAAPTQAPLVVSAEALRGKILFKSTRSGGKYPNSFNYFVMDSDGTNVTQLPKEAAAGLFQAQVSNAGYSPDRSYLVVGETVCGGGRCALYIAPPEVAVTRSQGQWTPAGPSYSRADQPVWSPDGNWVAFTWNRDNDRTKNIFKGMPFEQNQDFKRLTDIGGRRDTKSPTYSPDSAWLAFATQDGPRWQIWILDATAENFTDANAHNLSNSEFVDWDPIWIK